MSKKNSNAPFQSLEDIAVRKAQLRKQIKRQEKALSEDFKAYEDDVDMLKRGWTRLMNVNKLRKNMASKNISKKLSGLSALSNKSGWVTAATVGVKVLQWLWKRKSK